MPHRNDIIAEVRSVGTKSKMGRPELPVVLAEESLIDAQLALETAVIHIQAARLDRTGAITRALRRNIRAITLVASHTHNAA